MMKTGETSTDDQDEEVSAEILCLKTRQRALRKAISLCDAAKQAVEDAKGEIEKSAATQKLKTSEGFVALTLRRVEENHWTSTCLSSGLDEGLCSFDQN